LQVIEIVRKFVKDNRLMTYNNGMYRDFFRHLVLRKAEYNNQFLVNLVTSTIESGITFLEPLIRKLSEFVQSVYWTSKREESNVVLSDKITLIYGKSFIIEKLHINGEDYFFNISPFSFFQTNSRVAEILCDEVLRLLKPLNDDVLLDLYCGIGMIGISIARSVKKVVGVEQIKQAIDNAMENALVNAVSNLKFYVSDVQSWIKQNQSYFSAIILDPPRSGLTKGIIKFLISSKAKKIIYISCNPSILARDLMIITKNTEYKIKKITPVDMFPQTYHIETVVLLEL
jgi:23S rRNA (uracil-5-)-methyltransferase RumA